MAKEAYYFSHDLGARNDPKLQSVLMKLGHTGKSVFWDLVEMLYEEGGYLNLNECDNYAFALRTDCDCITKLINDFGLFKKDKNKFWSESVLRRLAKRNEKSEKAAKSAKSRWNKADASKKDANAMRTHSKRNTIKESKEEEIKEPIKNILEDDIFCTDSNLKEALEAFVKMRTKIKKPLTDHGKNLIKIEVWNLSNKNVTEAVKILNNSTMNSYQGVFKKENNNKHENKPTIPTEPKQFKL